MARRRWAIQGEETMTVAGTRLKIDHQENSREDESLACLKQVPGDRELRATIRRECSTVAREINRSVGLTKVVLERAAREILTKLNLPAGYVGWTMVVLSSEFWRDQVAAVPHS